MTSTPPHLPPTAAHHPVTRTFHGDEVVDDFEWLRDKGDPAVIAHLEAENAWTEAMTAHLEGLRQEIYDDVVARTQETDLTVPGHVVHEGTGWWYYSRTEEGKDYPIRCRVADVDGRRPDTTAAVPGEQVLLDENVEAAGHEFFSLGAFSVSPDGQRLAWSVDNAGDERFTLFVRDLATGRDAGPVLNDLGAGICWAGDDHLVYSRVDEAWRPFQVWMHHLDTDTATDRLLLQEDDERFWLGVDESRDRRHLVFMAGSKTTSECWLMPTDDVDGEPFSVAGRTEGIEYSIEVDGDRVLVLHNRDCVDYSLSTARLGLGRPDDWTTVVEGVEGTRLDGVDVYADHAVISAHREGLACVGVLDRAGAGWSAPRWTAFDEQVHEVSASSEPDWDSTHVRLHYGSLVTPPSVLDLDLASGRTTLLRSTPVLDHPVHGPYDPADYIGERLWATADDGTRIPISVVRHKDVDLDGSAPLVLYGYGSYEMSIPPWFVPMRLSFLQRGIVYAIAHVRGGGEMGRAWYEQGKMLAKTNTFTDFVACAERLVEAGYTSPDRLGAEGRSAGGLLMGAVTNLRPDLFRAVHAGVPFVDALTTILKPELPLTVGEWEEWGNPVTDEEVYRCMKAYTPYENIREGRYPAILATTSLNDTRVYFTEPAKWVARLRETVEASDERPILLRTEMVAGHAGVTGRHASWRERAFEMAWMIDQITPGGAA